MTKRPILFSQPMVQAIFSDLKTQTRRIVKLPKWAYQDKGDLFVDVAKQYASGISKSTGCEAQIMCPYGQPGDVLWVRETFAAMDFDGGFDYYYRADFDERGAKNSEMHWKPSIHMPYEACRLWLKVTGVRLERLQDISEDDAKAEGVERCQARNIDTGEEVTRYRKYSSRVPFDHPFHCCLHTARFSYWELWDKINGRDSWSDNPYVWVVTFERTEKPQEGQAA